MKRINFGGMLIFAGAMLAFLIIGYLFGATANAGTGDLTAQANPLRDLFGRGLSINTGASGSAMIDRAFEQLEDQYFMELDDETRQKMLYSALQGMMQPLRKDPYADDFTNFYDPEFYKNLMAETTGNYAGIGILMGVTVDGAYPEVNSVFKDTPAFHATIQQDDVITEVDGEDTYGMILPEVANKIKGEPGTKVKLKIYRPVDGEIKELEIERKNVTYSSVSEVEMADDKSKVGYIKITNFAEETGKDFRAAMEKLTAQGMKSVIIDMRDNPGGLLQAAVEVADAFVAEGPVVAVEFRGNAAQNETLSADPSTKKYKLPVVVMLNANSASASEVLASALRDYGVATIFGEKSFGKGVVQAVVPMELMSTATADKDGAVSRGYEAKSALAVVIGKYFTPKHVEIHKKGIEPDYWYNFQNQLIDDAKIKQYEEQLKAKRDEMAKIRTEATRYLRDKDTIKDQAAAVAAKLARGETVAKRPEVKPKEDEHSPLGLTPERNEPKEDDVTPPADVTESGPETLPEIVK